MSIIHLIMNRPSLLVTLLLLSVGFYLHSTVSASRSNEPPKLASRIDRKQEVLSEDCTAKRDSLVRKRRSGGRPQSLGELSPSHQWLRPKPDLSSSSRHFNISLEAEDGFEGGLDHVPECTDDGKYEPVQCWMAYCWCVNKYGQALRNSARTNEKPVCDRKLYDSESNDLLVVTGVGASKLKLPLKPSGSKNDRNDSGFGDQDGRTDAKGSMESEFSRRVGNSPEPSLALAPNECAMSRENALARKSKHTDLEGIWIPDCDPISKKLYAERQCHKSKVCWCVDQITGLPLRTNEQLTKGPGINCTEVRKIIEAASSKAKLESQREKPSYFQGFSESCDAERRSEFVHNLIGQFRLQLGDYLKHNPTVVPPSGVSSSNPYRLSGDQVAYWRFVLLDLDEDGKLNDREWSKFKVNFKLVEKLDVHLPEQQDIKHTISPLFILRSQRKCWRDFLEFCGDGDVLDYSSIDRAQWLSCTELPAASVKFSPTNDRSRFNWSTQNPGGVPDAYTRAAAETRGKSKNPFLPILKPD